MRSFAGGSAPVRRVAAALALALALAPIQGRAAAEDLTRHVDPMIGTFGSGFVFPGPAAPFGMVQVSPDTDGYFAYTGYLWSDQFIRGFSHVHVESMGVHAGGDVPFLPTIGPIVSTDPFVYRSRFDHATEHAEPGYYSALLETYGIQAELTAGLRVGLQRYTFPPSPQANVILDVGRSVAGTDVGPDGLVVPGAHPASVSIGADHRTVTGTVTNTDDHYTVRFASRFSRPFASFATWDTTNGTPASGTPTASGTGAGAAVTFDAVTERTVTVETGISFVSEANALANLDAEMAGREFDFDAVRTQTRAEWNAALHTIEVNGGTGLEKRSFYTALYHAQHHPNVFEDVNGEYMGNDNQVHVASGYTYYTNFSLWDTYRTENQLLALIQPARFRDMMRSLLAIATDGGRLPRWNLMNDYADFMIGEPAVMAIVDGFCRGLVPKETVAPLYDAMRSLLFTSGEGHVDQSYLDLGFVPADVRDDGASITEEHAIADFALALVADRLGKTADRKALLKMASNWRNVFDPETRFIRPRNSNKEWVSPFNPELPDNYREGNGWQYLWLVPHDVRGLIDAIGRPLAIERLDTFFAALLAEAVPGPAAEVQKHLSLFGIAYYGNQYTPANEHDLQAPYLYDYVGQPWKTQAIVRGLQQVYRPTPDGLPGNDDLGTMSAWYVWSALGFYPETAGAPLYAIGSPVFEHATIHLPKGTFTVQAPDASLANKYVQQASLNGRALTKTWFTHAAFKPGGSLIFSMGPVPNTEWGSAPADAPPSQTTSPLSAFGCR